MADYQDFVNVVELWDNAIRQSISTINPQNQTINTDNLYPAFRNMFEACYGAQAAQGDGQDFANRFFENYIQNTRDALEYFAKDPVNGGELLTRAARQDVDLIFSSYSPSVDANTYPQEVSERINEANRLRRAVRLEDIIRSLR